MGGLVSTPGHGLEEGWQSRIVPSSAAGRADWPGLPGRKRVSAGPQAKTMNLRLELRLLVVARFSDRPAAGGMWCPPGQPVLDLVQTDVDILRAIRRLAIGIGDKNPGRDDTVTDGSCGLDAHDAPRHQGTEMLVRAASEPMRTVRCLNPRNADGKLGMAAAVRDP